MAKDVSKAKDIVVINVDDDGPEEGEIQDDSSSDEELPRTLNSKGEFFKGNSYTNTKDVFFSEGKIKNTITLAESMPVRIGYPACVEEVYNVDRQWVVEKEVSLDNRSHHARKTTNGADYQVEKENKSKYHGRSKSSRRLRNSGSPSTPVNDTSKSRPYTKSEILHTSPVIGRRKSSRISRAQEKEKHKSRKHNSEEKRTNSKSSLRSNLLGKKLGLHEDSSDLEAQIQKTKQRFQNKECMISKASLPDNTSISPVTVTLSSSENPDLNKSSSSIEILDVEIQNQPEALQLHVATNETLTPNKMTKVEDAETSVDDNKEELNLRLIVLKSALHAKYGGKGKILKNKQNQVQKDDVLEQSNQKNKVETEVDVEPVDMDLSVTDDEKEGDSNNLISEIPVIVHSSVIEQANDAMFYQNWNESSREIPVHLHNEYIVVDEVKGSPPNHNFEADAVSFCNSSPSSLMQIQQLVTLNNEYYPSYVNVPAPPLQVTSTEHKKSNENKVSKKSSEDEDEDEELLRAQLLIAISNKQNTVPPSMTTNTDNVPPLVTETKPSTLSSKKTLLNQVNASKAGSKLILKEIFKSKKAQKLRKARSFKAPSKDIPVKPVLPPTSTLPAKKSLKKTAVKSSEVKATTQFTPSVGRFVICLGEDTESEEESDSTKQGEAPEKTVEKPPETVQSNLALNLDQFLKQVRQDVEQKQQPKNKQENELLQSKQMQTESSKDLNSEKHACASKMAYNSPKNSDHKHVNLNLTTKADTLVTVKESSVDCNQITECASTSNSPVSLQPKKANKLDVSETTIKDAKLQKDVVRVNIVGATPPKANKKIIITAPAKTSTKNLASTKKVTPKTPTQSKPLGQSKVPTPSAVSHLPSSQQMEYRRLKLEIARREELRKLKLKLGQSVTKSPSKINMQDPPKLEITVNNSSVEDETSSRVVRQALTSEDTNDTNSLNEDLTTNFMSVNKESELSDEEELKPSSSVKCDKKITENDNEVPCKLDVEIKNSVVFNENTDIACVLNVPQSEVKSKLSETAVEKPTEEKNVVSCKRKSLDYVTTSKRVKVNENDASMVQDPKEPSAVVIIKSSSPALQPVFNSQNLNQLPKLSISLSESGRSVEELTLKSEDSSFESLQPNLRPQSLPNEDIIEVKIEKDSVHLKNITPKKSKISKQFNTKNKISSTRKCQDKRSTISKQENKKALNKSETDLLTNREELLEQLKKLENLLGTVKHRQDQVADAEARVEALKRELTRAEKRAEEERAAVRKLFNQVGQVRIEVAQARTRCAGISKTCQHLGYEMKGKSYRVPQDRADELKIHLQQVVDLTQKTKKSRHITHPSTPLPNSNSDTPSFHASGPFSNQTLYCQAIDLNVSAIPNGAFSLSQTEYLNKNSAENCGDNTIANENLVGIQFCTDVQPSVCLQNQICDSEKKNSLVNNCIDLKMSKIINEIDISVPCLSNPILCETLSVTSSSNNIGAAPLLKPYKSPLEHMKLRTRVHEEGDDVDRNMDPNKVMCPYELTGRCNDDGCKYLHPCSSKQ